MAQAIGVVAPAAQAQALFEPRRVPRVANILPQPAAPHGSERPLPEPPPVVLAISQLLDGAVDGSWFSDAFRRSWVAAGGQPDGTPGVPWVRPAPRPWPHDHLHLDMPIPSPVEA